MDRRDTLKSLLIGAVAGGAIMTNAGCKANVDDASLTKELPGYGRQPHEKAIDEELLAKQYYTATELETIAVLCDIILPATATYRSATDAGVPEFIEFMTKDLKWHQLPMRGGLAWLDNYMNQRYNNQFAACSKDRQLELIDQIAFPNEDPSMAPGVAFFNRIRNLTLTGYYTTKEGIEELGYQGNRANVWDGVPEEVLVKHSVDYDPEWIARCVDQDKRMDIAAWDDDMNLIT